MNYIRFILLVLFVGSPRAFSYYDPCSFFKFLLSETTHSLNEDPSVFNLRKAILIDYINHCEKSKRTLPLIFGVGNPLDRNHLKISEFGFVPLVESAKNSELQLIVTEILEDIKLASSELDSAQKSEMNEWSTLFLERFNKGEMNVQELYYFILNATYYRELFKIQQISSTDADGGLGISHNLSTFLQLIMDKAFAGLDRSKIGPNTEYYRSVAVYEGDLSEVIDQKKGKVTLTISASVKIEPGDIISVTFSASTINQQGEQVFNRNGSTAINIFLEGDKVDINKTLNHRLMLLRKVSQQLSQKNSDSFFSPAILIHPPLITKSALHPKLITEIFMLGNSVLGILQIELYGKITSIVDIYPPADQGLKGFNSFPLHDDAHTRSDFSAAENVYFTPGNPEYISNNFLEMRHARQQKWLAKYRQEGLDLESDRLKKMIYVKGVFSREKYIEFFAKYYYWMMTVHELPFHFFTDNYLDFSKAGRNTKEYKPLYSPYYLGSHDAWPFLWGDELPLEDFKDFIPEFEFKIMALDQRMNLGNFLKCGWTMEP